MIPTRGLLAILSWVTGVMFCIGFVTTAVTVPIPEAGSLDEQLWAVVLGTYLLGGLLFLAMGLYQGFKAKQNPFE